LPACNKQPIPRGEHTPFAQDPKKNRLLLRAGGLKR
jgi:hypothetical protein